MYIILLALSLVIFFTLVVYCFVGISRVNPRYTVTKAQREFNSGNIELEDLTKLTRSYGYTSSLGINIVPILAYMFVQYGFNQQTILSLNFAQATYFPSTFASVFYTSDDSGEIVVTPANYITLNKTGIYVVTFSSNCSVMNTNPTNYIFQTTDTLESQITSSGITASGLPTISTCEVGTGMLPTLRLQRDSMIVWNVTTAPINVWDSLTITVLHTPALLDVLFQERFLVSITKVG